MTPEDFHINTSTKIAGTILSGPYPLIFSSKKYFWYGDDASKFTDRYLEKNLGRGLPPKDCTHKIL
jgi:hypothetical protein